MSNFKYNLQRNVKGLNKNFPTLKKSVVRAVLQICVFYIENKTYSPQILQSAIEKLRNSGNEVPENFPEIFAGIFLTIQTYLRTPRGSVKDDELKEILKELKFSDESIEDICKVMITRRDALSSNLYEIKALRNSPKKIQWKLNISLMDSELTRLSQPTIILHIQLNNQIYKTFEMNLAMFHRLRYTIALLLKEIQFLESRQIMKK